LPDQLQHQCRNISEFGDDIYRAGERRAEPILHRVHRTNEFRERGLYPPDSGEGDIVAIDGTFHILSLSLDYVSGNPLSDSSTYDNQTFSSLGVTPGTYVWTWGSGATADSFALDIEAAAVPEPSSLLVGVMLAALLIVRMIGRRWVHANTSANGCSTDTAA
jgi:hypothetical protein